MAKCTNCGANVDDDKFHYLTDNNQFCNYCYVEWLQGRVALKTEAKE